MKQGVFWAGAAVQIVLVQLIVWSLQAGRQPLGLAVAAVVVALGMLILYIRGVSRA